MPEDELLTSGEFGRRSRLSPKALRLYEQQGLLVPDEVDAASRYRRYRASRLADARRRPLAAEKRAGSLGVPGAALVVADVSRAGLEERGSHPVERLARDEHD